ncbi:membrane protein of ER body-like protein isoform X3 [Malania oleifera]|uniref:membrane protein of ER body-like protein isoform X3 n=1 Tax=Malania oleifera TaxID=397392 RepID=UPI0025AE689E|nr:membrane protein of ER body-like protein isoform X3 [Malania oleifera]
MMAELQGHQQWKLEEEEEEGGVGEKGAVGVVAFEGEDKESVEYKAAYLHQDELGKSGPGGSLHEAMAEVARWWKEDDEAAAAEAEGAALQERRPRRRKHAITATTITQTEEDPEEEHEERLVTNISSLIEDTGNRSSNGYFAIKYESIEHSISGTSSQDGNMDVPINDFETQRHPSRTITKQEEIVSEKILPGFKVVSSKKSEEAIHLTPSNNVTTKQAHVNLIKGSEGEVIEVDLERWLEDPEAYDFYCPNCNCCVKKVILRKRERERTSAQRDEPVDVFRCTSCFSFLIVAGHQLASFFVPDKEGTIDHAGYRNWLRLDVQESDSAAHPSHAANESTNDGVVINAPTEPQESQEDTVTSPVLEPKEPNEGIINVRWNSANAKKTNDTGNWFISLFIPNKKEVTFDPGYDCQLDVQVTDSSSHISHITDELESGKQGGRESTEVIVNVGGKLDDAMKRNDIDENDMQRDLDYGGPKNEIEEKRDIYLQQNIEGPEKPTVQRIKHVSSCPEVAIPQRKGAKGWEILKSIVYGGLIESIASLGIVTSAAGADADTVNILALGLANLIGGLFIIGHNLMELKNDRSQETSTQTSGQVDRYKELLGQRENFLLHATFVVLSFLIFGMVPVVTYAFSFWESDIKYLKLAAAMAVSLFCIIVLSIGKAHIQRPPKFNVYIKTVLYYACNGVIVSGISYIVGDLVMKLMDKLGWFKSSEAVALSLPGTRSLKPSWGSY